MPATARSKKQRNRSLAIVYAGIPAPTEVSQFDLEEFFRGKKEGVALEKIKVELPFTLAKGIKRHRV